MGRLGISNRDRPRIGTVGKHGSRVNIEPVIRPKTFSRRNMFRYLTALTNLDRLRYRNSSRLFGHAWAGVVAGKGVRVLVLLALGAFSVGQADAATVSGCAAEFPDRQCGTTTLQVQLQPGGLFAATDGDGLFSFDNVPAGSYTLTVLPTCTFAGCYDPVPVTVGASDVEVFVPMEVPPGGTTSGTGGGSSGPTNPVDFATLQQSFDLDVTYIERTPKYRSYCLTDDGQVPCASESDPICKTLGVTNCQCPGPDCLCGPVQNGKRTPAVGDDVTFIAHVKNKGGVAAPGFMYTWWVGGVVHETGSYDPGPSGLAPDNAPSNQVEALIAMNTTVDWPSDSQKVRFSIDSTTTGTDLFVSNNSLEVDTHAVLAVFYVDANPTGSGPERLYDGFNSIQHGLTGTYSFEDWLQETIRQANARLRASQYATVAPDGAIDQMVIDNIVIVAGGFGTGPFANVTYFVNHQYRFCYDGGWAWGQNDDFDYVDSYANDIDWPGIHELGHQVLSLRDLYNMNVDSEVQIEVQHYYGLPVLLSELPDVFPSGQWGLMGGASVFPHEPLFDPLNEYSLWWSAHSVAALNTDAQERRFNRDLGGRFFWDTPDKTYLKIVDNLGAVIPDAEVELFQRDYDMATRIATIDNIREIPETPVETLLTNAGGIVELPNRFAPSVTVVSGHTQKNNPFGEIDTSGHNGSMIVKITKGNEEWFRYLTIVDLNMAYWSGNTTSATITLGHHFQSNDDDQDEVPAYSDNCPGAKNTSQSDVDADGFGDACDCDPNDASLPVGIAPDSDCDGIPDASDDCPGEQDLGTDDDGDGVDDACDNCLYRAWCMPMDSQNPGQEDADCDGVGDVCDQDDVCSLVGDCDGGGTVVIGELIRLVNIALGNEGISECLNGDDNGDGEINVNELVLAVRSALSPCVCAGNADPYVCTPSGATTSGGGTEATISIGDGATIVGGTAPIAISLDAFPPAIGGLKVDVLFPNDSLSIDPATDCTLDPSLNPALITVAASLTTTPTPPAGNDRMRVIVFPPPGGTGQAGIPNGVVVNCNFTVKASAPPGMVSLVGELEEVSTTLGDQVLPTGVWGGEITICPGCGCP